MVINDFEVIATQDGIVRFGSNLLVETRNCSCEGKEFTKLVKSDNIRAPKLEIKYLNKKIKNMCEKQAVAKKYLGADCARKLLKRLLQLEAAKRVTDLNIGNPHPLKGDRSGQFALDLAGGRRLVFAPANDPCPTRPDGSIDWAKVTSVRIEYIGDYHD